MHGRGEEWETESQGEGNCSGRGLPGNPESRDSGLGWSSVSAPISSFMAPPSGYPRPPLTDRRSIAMSALSAFFQRCLFSTTCAGK